MRGYIDDKLVTQAADRPEFAGPGVFAAATLCDGDARGDREGGEHGGGCGGSDAEFARGGVGERENGKAIVLTGNPQDMNSRSRSRWKVALEGGGVDERGGDV